LEEEAVVLPLLVGLVVQVVEQQDQVLLLDQVVEQQQDKVMQVEIVALVNEVMAVAVEQVLLVLTELAQLQVQEEQGLQTL
tara:strand:+ start:137 stop:379 length:243 start_codon:yes stop_codon:yes gene_type:complete